MNDETLKKILEIVKNRLEQTWLDEVTEKTLTLMIQNAVDDLDRLSGIKNDYILQGKAQELMLMRIMYDRENALDDFYINYKSELVAFINRAKVKKYAQKQKEQSE